jgi:hypothetical protein
MLIREVLLLKPVRSILCATWLLYWCGFQLSGVTTLSVPIGAYFPNDCFGNGRPRNKTSRLELTRWLGIVFKNNHGAYLRGNIECPQRSADRLPTPWVFDLEQAWRTSMPANISMQVWEQHITFSSCKYFFDRSGRVVHQTLTDLRDRKSTASYI